MHPVVFVCRFAVWLASLLVPRTLRGEWTGQWMAEIRHGYVLLTERGESAAAVWSKLLRFARGAFADAADLRGSGFDARQTLGHPAFCLAAPLAVWVMLLAATHDFQNCRQALAGLPARQPEQLVLLSRPVRVMGIEAAPSSADFLAWQRQWKGAPLAGFVVDGPVLRVTPAFYEVLGSVPRLPFHFLGHTIRAIAPLDRRPVRMGVLARLQDPRRPADAEAALGRISGDNDVSVRIVGVRMREPLVFALAVFAMALGIGILLARRRSRGILFFAAKTALVEGALIAAWAEVSAGLPIPSSGAASLAAAYFFPGLLLIAAAVALWWSLHDQRSRCPVCFRRLEMPVRIGSHGSLILDRPGVEVLCLQGHGSLLIPAADPALWTAFHESWKDCFAQGGSK